MGISDTISALLELTGLRKSDLRKCDEAIAAHDERIRDLYDSLAGRNGEVEALEARLRKLKAKYAAATPNSKSILEPQIRSLIGDFRRLKELQAILLRNIEKEKQLRQARLVERENILHPPDADAIDEAADAKKDAIADLKDEDGAITHLAAAEYTRPEVEEDLPAVAPKVSDETLMRDLDAILGEGKAPTASEPEPEPA